MYICGVIILIKTLNNMRKILLGMAVLAGLVSCSKDEVSGDDDKVKTGLYKVVATYSSSTAKTKQPISINFTFGTEGNLYTYSEDGSVKKIEGKVYTINDYASVKDTTVSVFTDNDNLLSVAFIAVSTEDGNQLSYDIAVSRNGENVENFKEDNIVLDSGKDKTIIY